MADLPPPQTSSAAATFAVDSDDISSLLHTLLHNSSQHHPRQFSGTLGFTEPPPGLLDPNFSFPGGYYTSAAGLSMDGIDDADCNSEEETRGKSASGRSSSKRSRAAEVHNMSEKRRRQRINEKMKALQKLIPNSNKTDKASMLDEAIEYLKQLQLQVQMLTMRNGSTSHPIYLRTAVQPPSAGPLNEANSCRVDSFTADQEASMQAMLNLSSKPASSDYKLLMNRMSENNISEQPYVPEPSISLQYRPFIPSTTSKVLSKDPVLPQ